MPSTNLPKRLALFLLPLFLASPTATAADSQVVDDYRALQAALGQDEPDNIDSRLEALAGTHLEGHAEMAVLRARLDDVAADRVATFVDEHADLTGMASFRVAWMRELADREAWQRLADTYNGERDVHVRCAVVVARRELGRIDAAVSLALDLWRVGYRQPGRCNEAFDLLQAQGELTAQRLRQRMQLAIAAGNPDLARAYIDRLPASQRVVVGNWLTVYRHPDEATRLTAKGLGTADERRTVLVSALRRLARANPRQAKTTWERVRQDFPLTDAAAGRIDRTIALQAAYSGLDEGDDWLAALPRGHATEAVHAWLVRDALRDGDWQAVRARIEAMPEAQAKQSRWRYWRARALRATGNSDDARQAFESLASQFNYHGYLAADAIASVYTVGEQPPAEDDDAQTAVRGHERAWRALLLHRSGDEAMAIDVWRRAVDALDTTRARLAAARVAAANNWPWAAMYASGVAGYRGAHRLRFPEAYSELVTTAASRHDIPKPWIHALIRQESAFRNTACSSAGACGLTQLMPGTGRWMLERMGRKTQDLTGDLARPELNIQAGTGYLAHLRQRFDHPVSALAAYNAGPGNVERWLEDTAPRPGSARWIETLPFGETRDYVIGVLFNKAVYELLAANPSPRLDPILAGRQ